MYINIYNIYNIYIYIHAHVLFYTHRSSSCALNRSHPDGGQMDSSVEAVCARVEAQDPTLASRAVTLPTTRPGEGKNWSMAKQNVNFRNKIHQNPHRIYRNPFFRWPVEP